MATMTMTAADYATRRGVPLKTAYEELIRELDGGTDVAVNADVRGGVLLFDIEDAFIYPDRFGA